MSGALFLISQPDQQEEYSQEKKGIGKPEKIRVSPDTEEFTRKETYQAANHQQNGNDARY
ncbi:MAG: hypothetical protein JW861_02150 [Bacteroidales bacterium]|nr:hypothetical protein [Bacteroidales bacterium]